MQGQLIVFAQPLKDGVQLLEPRNANDDSATEEDREINRAPVKAAIPHMVSAFFVARMCTASRTQLIMPGTRRTSSRLKRQNKDST